MESICEWSNMKRTVRRVVKNQGAPGVDGMTVRQVKRYLRRHWDKIEKALLGGQACAETGSQLSDRRRDDRRS